MLVSPSTRYPAQTLSLRSVRDAELPFPKLWGSPPAPRARSRPSACTCPRPGKGGREGGSLLPAEAAPMMRQLRRDGAGQECPSGSSPGRSVPLSPAGLPVPHPAGQPLGNASPPAGARTSLARIRWLFSSVQRSEKTLLWRKNSKALTTIQQAAQRRRSTRVHRRQILSRSRFKPGMPLIVSPRLGSRQPLQPLRPRAKGSAWGCHTPHLVRLSRSPPAPISKRPPPRRFPTALPSGTGPAPAPPPLPLPSSPGRCCPYGDWSAPFEFEPRSSAGFCLLSPVPSGPCGHLCPGSTPPPLPPLLPPLSFSPENKRGFDG